MLQAKHHLSKQKLLSYNNIKNKFDLSQYRQDIEANLINKIIEEISIFLISN